MSRLRLFTPELGQKAKKTYSNQEKIAKAALQVCRQQFGSTAAVTTPPGFLFTFDGFTLALSRRLTFAFHNGLALDRGFALTFCGDFAFAFRRRFAFAFDRSFTLAFRRRFAFTLGRHFTFTLNWCFTFALNRRFSLTLGRCFTLAFQNGFPFTLALNRGFTLTFGRCFTFAFRRRFAFALDRGFTLAFRRRLAFALDRGFTFAFQNGFPFTFNWGFTFTFCYLSLAFCRQFTLDFTLHEFSLNHLAFTLTGGYPLLSDYNRFRARSSSGTRNGNRAASCRAVISIIGYESDCVARAGSNNMKP